MPRCWDVCAIQWGPVLGSVGTAMILTGDVESTSYTSLAILGWCPLQQKEARRARVCEDHSKGGPSLPFPRVLGPSLGSCTQQISLGFSHQCDWMTSWGK